MYVKVKNRAITYIVTLKYGTPDAYNKYSKDNNCEIGIRLDRFWKYYPSFDNFLDKLIFYQLVERICLEIGLMKTISKYPCSYRKCPMEIPALIMLDQVENIFGTVPIGYKLRRFLKMHFTLSFPVQNKINDFSRIQVRNLLVLKSKIIKYIRDNKCVIGDYNNATGFFTKLNYVMKLILKKAVDRAKENKRKIVMPFDV